MRVIPVLSFLALLTPGLAVAQNAPFEVCLVDEASHPIGHGIVEIRVDGAWERHATGAGHCAVLSVLTGVEAPDVPRRPGRLQAWPNPFSDALRVDLPVSGDEHADLEVFDVTGRRVLSAGVPPIEGGMQQAVLRLGGLTHGLYVVRMTTAAGVHSTTVVKSGNRTGERPGLRFEGSTRASDTAGKGSALVELRLTAPGFRQITTSADAGAGSVDIRLDPAPRLRIHAVDMGNHDQALTDGVLHVEEIRSGLMRSVDVSGDVTDVLLESDSMRIRYENPASASGGGAFTSGRQAIRFGAPGQYGDLAAAAFSFTRTGPLYLGARHGLETDAVLFAMRDDFPYVEYFNDQFAWQGHTLVTYWPTPDPDHLHTTWNQHHVFDPSRPEYYDPDSADPMRRRFRYRFQGLWCDSFTTWHEVSDSMQADVNFVMEDLYGRLYDLTYYTVSFRRVEESYAADSLVWWFSSGPCVPRAPYGRGASMGNHGISESGLRIQGHVQLHPGVPGQWETDEDGNTTLVGEIRTDARRIARNVSENFAIPDLYWYASSSWREWYPKITEPPAPPAVTDWLQRWVAVQVAYGPIHWSFEYEVGPIRGLWHSIYW